MTEQNLSDSNSTSQVVTIGLTDAEIWIQAIVFFLLMGGIVPIFGNSLMAVGIIRSKKLRTRFYIILWFLLVCRTIYGFQFTAIGMHRVLRTVNIIDLNLKRSTCFALHFQMVYLQTLEMVLLLGLVIDRAFAILAHNFYRLLTIRQAIVGSSIASVITIMCKVIPSVFGVDFNEVIACINGYSSLSLLYVPYHQNIDLVIALLILVLYVALLMYVNFIMLPALELAAKNGDSTKMVSFKRQTKLLILLRRLVLVHVGLALAGKFLLSISGFTKGETSLRLTAYARMSLNIDLFANTVMLFTGNQDLRRAATPWLAAQTVAPTTANPSTRHHQAIIISQVRTVGVTHGQRQMKNAGLEMCGPG